ncbi:MAG: hypothetical protein E6J91_41755, partial [Deltaproteobacteria bacterium]
MAAPAPPEAARPPSKAPPQVGSTIKHYELLRKLGEGGMGAVYVARDTALGRLVAIKVLQVDSGANAQRFLIEAQATARCRHDNIVVIHEVDEFDGYPYMVLEYLEGHTLRDWMSERAGPVAPGLAVELLLPVVRALACAHQLGIVHRDLKPENIFLTRTGRVVVLDFGIAKRLDASDISVFDPVARPFERGARLTQDGALLGTLPYMSPEQLRCQDIDGRSDLWTVGILLHELVVGAHPLAHCSVLELLDVGESDAPMPSVRDGRPDIDALGTIIDRCLCKARDERHRSADELLAGLEGLARDRAAHAQPGWMSAPRSQAALTAVERPPPSRLPAGTPRSGSVIAGRRRLRELLARRIGVIAAGAAAVVVAVVAVVAARAVGGPGDDRPRPVMAAPRIALPAVDVAALPERDRWLGAAVQRLVADELVEAWGLDVELGSAARPAPDALVVATSLARGPSGGLRLAVDGGALEAASPRELAIAAAARLVTSHVPAEARHPTAAELAAVGAHDVEAWRLWRRAEHETLLMRWERAARLCRQALARDPEFPIASLELALTYGNEDAAGSQELAHALDLMKRVPVRPLWHLAVSGALQLRAGDDAGAGRTAEQLLRLDLTPREQLWIELRWDMARYYNDTPPAEVVPRLVLLTEVRPDHPSAFKLLATMYLRSDQPTAVALALRYATRAVELAPEDAEARAMLAIALWNARRPAEARARAAELARFDPEDKRLANYDLFSLHMALGDLDEAELDAQRQLTGSAGQRVDGSASLA